MYTSFAAEPGLIGISHHIAPLEIREKLTVPDKLANRVLAELRARSGAKEALVLSTCNRTEYYCVGADMEQVRSLATVRNDLLSPEIEALFYVKRGLPTIKHAFSVACGLDSMILGEPEILGQVKQAYRTARGGGHAGQLLSRLFEHSFRVAKQVRSSTAIGRESVSVPALCVKIACGIFGSLRNSSVLCIGAGAVVTAAAAHLSSRNVAHLAIASRTAHGAAAIAGRYGATALSLEEALHDIARYDIIITATSSPIPVLGKGLLESALLKRKHRPIAAFDLAVPRDIEPEAAALEDLFLHTIDDIGKLSDKGKRSREDACAKALELVSAASIEFSAWLASRSAAATAGHLRKRIDHIRNHEAQRAAAAIARGAEPTEQALLLARRLCGRLAHDPLTALSRAGCPPEIVAEIGDWYKQDASGGDGTSSGEQG